MSFKNFIYYCMIYGGIAGFCAWLTAYVLRFIPPSRLMDDVATGAVIGLLVAGVIGALDALLNSVGIQRFVRVFFCMVVGLLGGAAGAGIGAVLQQWFGVPRLVGWTFAGTAIGAGIAVFDLQRALLAGKGMSMARRKLINGIIGGTLGGVLGGFCFDSMGLVFSNLFRNWDINAMQSPAAFGITILGMCIGLLIGLAQVLLKEAWIRVEKGFRPGREMMLTKPETTVGRAESCDIGLFGDNKVEKIHVKIILQNGRYMLADQGTPDGTYLNGDRITEPAPLRNGDIIRVGKNELRFGERTKR
jgi:hypothetical protein